MSGLQMSWSAFVLSAKVGRQMSTGKSPPPLHPYTNSVPAPNVSIVEVALSVKNEVPLL